MSDMDPAIYNGIISTAQSLGMKPADLAAIISYETAGTFNPTIAGPTTKWGQMRGLIQFGEPQAQQYGVDWADPINSQLGPNGAIVKYFTDHGWQPGMGMMDAYSVVNAGAPGRYNASDAAAGGAPGTVADKVNTQFAPHMAKAAALFGGAPMAGPAGGPAPQGMPPAPPSALAAMFAPLAQPVQGVAERRASRAQDDAARKQALFGSLYG